MTEVWREKFCECFFHNQKGQLPAVRRVRCKAQLGSLEAAKLNVVSVALLPSHQKRSTLSSVASDKDRLAFSRRAGGQTAPAQPVKVLPKLSDSLRFKNPQYQQALLDHEVEQEAWRKSLSFPSSETTVVQTSAATGATGGGTGGGATTGGGTKGDKGDTGPPGPNKFLCPDNGLFYSIVPRLGDDGVTIGTQWALYTGP